MSSYIDAGTRVVETVSKVDVGGEEKRRDTLLKKKTNPDVQRWTPRQNDAYIYVEVRHRSALFPFRKERHVALNPEETRAVNTNEGWTR